MTKPRFKGVTKEQVVRLAKDLLSKVSPGIKFEVIEAGVRQEDVWWYVPVLATRNGQDLPREFMVNVYANVEDELQQQHDLSVLFVPVVSEPTISAPPQVNAPRSTPRRSAGR